MPPSHQPKRYEELDALRGIAALMVVFFHLTFERPPYNTILKLGTTGVDLFFMISGFVIFMSLQKISGKQFVINRVSRLYPTYWASVTFTFIVILIYFFVTRDVNIDPVKTVLYYLGNLTMFQFYMRVPNLDIPYWTMIIEMLFYISILVLYRFKLLKHLTGIGIALCLLSVGLARLPENKIAFVILHGFPLLQFIPMFLAGILFYKIYTKQQRLLLHYALLLVCMLCQFALFPFVGGSHFYISYTGYGIMLLLFFGLFTLFVNHKLMIIVNPVTLFFGKISFALYLTHQFISLTVILPWLVDRLHMNFWVVVWLIDVPVIVIVASVITYLIEIPLGKRMKTALQKRFQ